MNQNENGRVVSLKALIFTLLSGWRKILLVGLIFALLLGGYCFYKKWPSTVSSSEGAVSQAVSENNGMDPASVGNMIDVNLSEKSDYLNNSILAKINPAAEGRAEVNLFVSTEDLENLNAEDANIDTIITSSPDSTDSQNVISSAETSAQIFADRILNAYLSYALRSVDFSELAEKMNTDPLYLKELISIEDIQNDIAGAKIVVRYIDADGAKEILDTVISQLTAQKDSISQSNGDHTIHFENEVSATVVDDQMFSWLNNRVQEMNNLMNSQDTYQTASSSHSSSGMSESTQVSRKSVLKDVLKYALVGFVGGIILYLLFGMLVLILMKRVLSGKELNQQYKLQKLAIFPVSSGKKQRGLDKMIASVKNADKSADQEEACYNIASANICYLAPENAKLLLVGDLPSVQMQNVLDHLKASAAAAEDGKRLSFLDSGNRLDDPNSLHLLSEADAVVLVAKTGFSRYAALDEIIRTASVYGKEILGSIVV